MLVYLYLYYLYLYHALSREAMQHTAEPDQECWCTVLVLVQMLVQVGVQAQVQWMVVFLGIALVKQHTAAPNVYPNFCK